MTTERKEALELALEAGLKELFGWRDRYECGYYFEGWPEHVEKLVRLAKQRGAEEVLERAALLCEGQSYMILDPARMHTAEELCAANKNNAKHLAALIRKLKP